VELFLSRALAELGAPCFRMDITGLRHRLRTGRSACAKGVGITPPPLTSTFESASHAVLYQEIELNPKKTSFKVRTRSSVSVMLGAEEDVRCGW
jgi:hypothetical protein